MGLFKSYLKPHKKAEEAEPAKPMEMSTAVSTPLGVSGSGTPRYSLSRPTSLYPTGDFRNSAMDDIKDIKADVMINWLHQQQLEKMWANGGQSEGVILKKSRDDYTCCPPELAQYTGDFFDAVRALNVRVCTFLHVVLILLSKLASGCDDCQHQNCQSSDATR